MFCTLSCCVICNSLLGDDSIRLWPSASCAGLVFPLTQHYNSISYLILLKQVLFLLCTNSFKKIAFLYICPPLALDFFSLPSLPSFSEPSFVVFFFVFFCGVSSSSSSSSSSVSEPWAEKKSTFYWVLQKF